MGLREEMCERCHNRKATVYLKTVNISLCEECLAIVRQHLKGDWKGQGVQKQCQTCLTKWRINKPVCTNCGGTHFKVLWEVK